MNTEDQLKDLQARIDNLDVSKTTEHEKKVADTAKQKQAQVSAAVKKFAIRQNPILKSN
jgi:hypothetical protein